MICRARLLALALLVIVPSLAGQEPAKPTIAVLDFTNGSLVNHDEYAPLSQGLADMLITDLAENPRIVVVERDRLKALLDEQDLSRGRRIDGSTAARIGRILGAEYVIAGAFLIDRTGALRIDTRAVNVETSVVTQTESVSGKAADLLPLVGQLATQLNTALRLPPYTAGRAPGRSPPAAGPDKKPLHALLAYSRAIYEADRNNRPEAVKLFQSFLDQTADGSAPAQRKAAAERIRLLNGKEP